MNRGRNTIMWCYAIYSLYTHIFFLISILIVKNKNINKISKYSLVISVLQGHVCCKLCIHSVIAFLQSEI